MRIAALKFAGLRFAAMKIAAPNLAALTFAAVMLAALTTIPAAAQETPAPGEMPRAFVDGTGPGWRTLTESDFADVNGRPDTWEWNGELLRTTGEPAGVYRTEQVFRNFEMVIEWQIVEPAGDSGIFFWVPWQGLADLEPGDVPPFGIQTQILDHAFADGYRERTGEEPEFATTHGDVFPIGQSSFIPFPPLSPDGSRSFPSQQLSRPAGSWNHYYVRAVNGELRLWVNGEEVAGGNSATPSAGYICLEAAGSPVEFRNIRVRELP